eukprot:1046821-Lingulodinium_polyedra.AAC.1
MCIRDRCDTLRDSLRVLAEHRFSALERRAALYATAGLHRSLLAFTRSRPGPPADAGSDTASDRFLD